MSDLLTRIRNRQEPEDGSGRTGNMVRGTLPLLFGGILLLVLLFSSFYTVDTGRSPSRRRWGVWT